MNKKIIDAMSDIDFDYVEDARPRGRRRFGVITVAAAAVLALALGLGTVARMMIKPRSGDKAEENKQAYLDLVKKLADYTTDVKVNTEDRLVMLSTCAYEFENARYIVACKMVPHK